MLKSPFHPGYFLKQLIAEHDISRARLARNLGVQIGFINQICDEKQGISSTMAITLSKTFGTSPDIWLNLQLAFEMQQ